ncbi:hypothetical protein WICANDRAFT_81221 [Wickerhamomyces anomalus NRRL Y-366-8]|uniref:F-box domain-containing protein n=1 Tax=Wickerhamomyces anomalus (strain ATCC 58044 / CBS 1984 / NCYC 433 / NRRL Y-366-8) TaxID=683960 RepID=A0A1E3NV63_WICAA|nr:uncharacterized protein WICANDRAFT_81221 [Wickerhamomyces anomalus NRRL Y-366-8]ODQ56985.1 hypothetical protein WICANDRAFT_81221 [Wickerhamomyces anomalus NRRL Y-366-8]
MDYLTTNFNTELMDINFTAPFRLMNLPLEIIIKILIFLDIPDLVSLSRTCTLLKRLANDNFISSSRFLYTRDKIGISIQNRPTVDSLYSRHIIPIRSPSFNPNQLLIVSMLTKSIVKDNLKKNLQKRPSLKELKDKNIVKGQTTEFVQSKIKEFKKQNLSSMLTVYVNSYKFQKKTNSSTSIMNEEEYSSILGKFYSNLKKIPSTLKKAKSQDSITTSIDNNTSTKFLNHFENKDVSNNKHSKRSISLDSKVFSKKQYFENLIQKNEHHENVDNDESITSLKKSKPPSAIRKPSRTLLRASIVNDCKISYEKVF